MFIFRYLLITSEQIILLINHLLSVFIFLFYFIIQQHFQISYLILLRINLYFILFYFILFYFILSIVLSIVLAKRIQEDDERSLATLLSKSHDQRHLQVRTVLFLFFRTVIS